MKPGMESNMSSPVVIGIDIGKGGVSPRRVHRRWEDCLPQEDQATGSQRCLREVAAVHRRHGSLPERAFCQQDAACVGARATNYPGDLRQALRERTEERLQRRRGNRRSGVATNLRVVKEKSQDQLELQACHRVRSAISDIPLNIYCLTPIRLSGRSVTGLWLGNTLSIQALSPLSTSSPVPSLARRLVMPSRGAALAPSSQSPAELAEIEI